MEEANEKTNTSPLRQSDLAVVICLLSSYVLFCGATLFNNDVLILIFSPVTAFLSGMLILKCLDRIGDFRLPSMLLALGIFMWCTADVLNLINTLFVHADFIDDLITMIFLLPNYFFGASVAVYFFQKLKGREFYQFVINTFILTVVGFLSRNEFFYLLIALLAYWIMTSTLQNGALNEQLLKQQDLLTGLYNRRCFATVMDETVRHSREKGKQLFISLNLSPLQLLDQGFVDYLKSLTGELGLNPSLIHLDVGNDVIMGNSGATKKAQRLIRAIISLSESLGVRASAVGVETAAQELKLKEAGVSSLQGFYYSRPLEDRAFERKYLS